MSEADRTPEAGRTDETISPSGAAPVGSGGRSRTTLYITLIAAVAALGGLLFGFDTGVIAGAMLFIVPDFHLGPAQQGLVVSAVTFGALFGALVGGTSSDAIGRRWTNIAAG
jgi:major inositol transporter-like SP family MFS transporter